MFFRGVGKGSLKIERKRTGGGGQAYLYVHSVKNCLIFQKVLSEIFLISCLAVAKFFFCFELSPAYKVGFSIKNF